MKNLAKYLSYEERLQAINNIDYILEFIGIPVAKRAKKEPDWETQKRLLEAKVNHIISRSWEEKVKESTAKAIEILEIGGVTAAAAKVISGALEPILGLGLTARVVTDTKLIDHVLYAYDMAGRRTAKLLKLPYALTFVDEKAKAWLTKDLIYWIGQYYNEHIKEAVTKTVIQYAIEEGQNAWTTGQRIKDILTGTYEIPPDYLPRSYIRAEAYWEGLASNAITRATVFGSVEQWVQAEVTEYEILTAEDERVCSICGHMHGKKFTIEQAVGLRDKTLNAKSPEDIKEINPWPKLSEIKDWDSDKLAAGGMQLPPFHFHCRCDVVATEFKEYTSKNLVTILKYPGQPRDEKGRFSSGHSIYVKKAIPLSNSYGSIKQGTRIEGVKTIASGKDIREVGRLVNTYPLQNGGKTNKTDWHKKRGTAIILHKDTGAEHIREVHWYECKNIGKVEFKVKIPKMGDAE